MKACENFWWSFQQIQWKVSDFLILTINSIVCYVRVPLQLPDSVPSSRMQAIARKATLIQVRAVKEFKWHIFQLEPQNYQIKIVPLIKFKNYGTLDFV